MNLITVLEAILTGRQTLQKLQCWHKNPMGNDFPNKMTSEQFLNSKVKILNKRLH